MDFKLSWGNKKVGWKYVLRFTLIFSIGMIASFLITLFTKSFQPFPHPLTAKNMLGYLGFQLFLSGPSEELIFRAFAITMLGLVVRGRAFSGKVSLANIVAAVIFGLAHVSFSFAPFQVSYSPMQVVFSVALGISTGIATKRAAASSIP